MPSIRSTRATAGARLRRNAAGWLGAVAAAAAALLSPGCASLDAHPNALWHVVHDLCVPDQSVLHIPAPCSKVDLQGGYAVVPDPGPLAQVLLVPTRRIVGIEAPYLLEPQAPNYWQDAWQARAVLERRIGAALPHDVVAMAVNAALARSQEQLHIHVSCVRPDVAEALAGLAPTLGERWSTITLSGRSWRARALAGPDLGAANPFKLLAGSEAAGVDMSYATLVVVGATLADGAPGFVLLSRMADPATGYGGRGEFLLDETCSAVRGSAKAGS